MTLRQQAVALVHSLYGEAVEAANYSRAVEATEQALTEAHKRGRAAAIEDARQMFRDMEMIP